MAGYSKRSLAEKLGLKGRAHFSNAPDGYLKILGKLPAGCEHQKKLTSGLEFIQHFSREKADLVKSFPKLKKALSNGGALWVSWPKGASKVATDLNENVVREIGLKNGLVDVKVCAVDEVWSGLKFVYRLEDRA
jgi:hypothetical protein